MGRTGEQQLLARALDAACDGTPQVHVLTGESGIGKTRLLGAIADAAAARGCCVLRGTAFEVEANVPYTIVGDAFGPWLRTLDPGARTVLARGSEGELAPVLPGVFTGRRAPGADDALEARARTYWAFAQLVGRMAAKQPLVLLLDNLQWADIASLELLHFVIRQALAGAIDGHLLVLGAWVAPDAGTSASRETPLQAVARSVASLPGAHLHSLAPLAAGEAHELIVRTFGASDDENARRFAAALHGWTGGNPFFIETTLASLIETGALRRTAGGWDGWGLLTLTPPAGTRDLVLARLARLGDGARRVLEAAAVIGARIRSGLLLHLVPLPEGEVLHALDALRDTGLLVETRDGEPRYEFSHPIVRDAIRVTLGIARAQALHGRVAALLEREYGSAAPAHADELAFHHAAGTGSGERAVHYLVLAGRSALARHADDTAARYLADALRRIDQGAPAAIARGELLDLLARAHQRRGETADARRCWLDARAQAAADGERARVATIERRLGLLAATAGAPAHALAHFDAGVAALDGADVNDGAEGAEGCRLRLARAMALHALGRQGDAVADARAALDVATTQRDPALLARAHRALLLLHTWGGPADTAREHGRAALEQAMRVGDPVLEWSVRRAMAIHAGLTGDAFATGMHLRESERIAREIRSPVLELRTSDIAIEYLAGTGAWDDALAVAERAIPAARQLGEGTLLPRLLAWTGLVHRGLGDLDRARACIDEAWELAGAAQADPSRGLPSGDVHAIVPAHTARAGYLMAISEHVAAIAVAERGLAIADAAGYVAWAIYRLLPVIIESALYDHDLERAARHADRLRRHSEAMGHALGVAWADATDGLIAWLRGDAGAAVPALRAAHASLERVAFVFDAARLRRFVGKALLDLGHREEALGELGAAHDAFARLRARRELALVRAELRALGVRPSTRSDPRAGPLSARELEIAALVAARKSNKEIAAALRISPRTVSTHLSNIFARVGARSRGELVDLVRAGELRPTT